MEQMRGPDGFTESMFTVLKLDDFVPKDHPLRPIRTWLNDALKRMDDVFAQMYEVDVKGGRPSIAPEKLVRALLLQVLYSIRSERMLVEQISYNMLFRWFVGLPMDGTVWDHSTFSKNRDRLLEHDVLVLLFNETVETARERGYLSGEHFSVDGTLIQAWAGHKSFVPKASPDDDDMPPDEPPAPNDNWHGKKRSNETHQSTTDEQARLFRLELLHGCSPQAGYTSLPNSEPQGQHARGCQCAGQHESGRVSRSVLNHVASDGRR
jgi:transposase